MVLTLAEMKEKIRALGLTRAYKPFNDPENKDREPGREVILLECRKPIHDYRKPVPVAWGPDAKGAEIDIYDSTTVRVWTSQKTKANQVAKANGFKVRLLDGEAELYLPISRADEFLHAFGAKVGYKVNRTPEQIQRSTEALKAYRAKKALAPTP